MYNKAAGKSMLTNFLLNVNQLRNMQHWRRHHTIVKFL